MPSTTVTDAIVFPQDPGTGIASQNDPPSGGLWALHNQHVSGSGGYLINADQGSIDLTVDAANDEVTLGAGACYIAESGGSVSVQESVGDTYGVGLPASVEIVYVVVLPTDVTVGLDVDATNDIYLSLDPTTRNSVTVTTGNGISAPADPSLFRGTVDASAGSVVENANQYPETQFERVNTDTLDVLDVDESPQSIGTATSPVEIDVSLSNWWQPISLTENVTVNLNNASAAGNSLLLYFEDGDGAGPYTLTWPASVVWSGGSAITEVPANGNIRISLTSPDGGTTWYATDAGSEFA